MENIIFSEPSLRPNPLNDYLFLKVFGEKGDEKQLIGLLNAILLRTGKELIKTVDIIENKDFIADTKDGKACSLDVRAVLESGTKVNIEVQLKNEHNMDRRTLFYWSRNYPENFKAGQDYMELPDVININIVDFDYPPDGDFHTCFHLREDKNKSIILTQALEIHFINMTKWYKLKGKDIVNDPLHRWLTYFDIDSPPELIKEVLKMDSAILAANEKQNFVMQSEEERLCYFRREKAIFDEGSRIKRTKREIARNLKKMGIPTQQIAEGTGLSLEEITKL